MLALTKLRDATFAMLIVIVACGAPALAAASLHGPPANLASFFGPGTTKYPATRAKRVRHRLANINVLYNFKGGANDGSVPNTAIAIDAAGALYVTTKKGGASEKGTIVKLTPAKSGSYKETVLHAFSGPDGSDPEGTLLLDGSGVLYGTTASGGDPVCQCGTIFSMTPNKRKTQYTFAILYRFIGGQDGATPMAGLVEDTNGILYGTTEFGGGGNGTLFEYDTTPSGLRYQQGNRLAYTQYAIDIGYYPVASLVVWNSQAYGMLLLGATSTGGLDGGGSMFVTVPVYPGPWAANPAAYFRLGGQPSTGYSPVWAPIQVSQNPDAFAGTTEGGGTDQCSCGLVYLMTYQPGQGLSETVLHEFAGSTSDGTTPAGSLAVDQNGNLLGATTAGGTHNAGIAYEITYTLSSATETIFYDFGGTAGSAPLAGFTPGPNSMLFGTASQGGTHNAGTVYAFPVEP